MGAVVDVLQRAGSGEHQRHVAVDHHARGHRLAVPHRVNGRDVTVLDLGQDEQAVQSLLRIELRCCVVCDVQAKTCLLYTSRCV